MVFIAFGDLEERERGRGRGWKKERGWEGGKESETEARVIDFGIHCTISMQ